MLESFIKVQYCYEYLINQVPVGLVLYSHIPTAFAALLFSIYVLRKAKNLPSLTLFFTCFFFFLWCISDLVSWFSFLGSAETMFAWSLLDLYALLMFFFSYYFLYSFTTGRDLPMWQKIIGVLIILPTAVWTFLGSNLPVYDANSCAAIEDLTVVTYPYFAEAIFILVSFIFIFIQYKKNKSDDSRKKVILSGIGIIIFLVFFFSATLLVYFLAESDASLYVYNYELYALFGMPLLLAFLAFVVVRYNAFNIKIAGTQALIVSLVVLLGSQFLFIDSNVARILVSLTLIVTGVIGINLIRSVKKEIKQREEIEKLANDLKSTNDNLEHANTRLKELDKQKTEFVSFATHQLRSPLTAMKGYSSLILEGDYGDISTELREAVQKIYESSNTLTTVVNDYLNVSRIELGSMKYDFQPIDLKDLVKQVIAELQPNIDKAGIGFTFKVDARTKYMAKIDTDKFKQVIANLIDNSMKYTPKGDVVVSVTKGVASEGSTGSKILFAVKDTGIGMAEGVIPKLFAKFSRAENANKVNIRGTGLGLFVAKEIVRAHGGRVWAESEGEGKGSQFYVELPAEK